MGRDIENLSKKRRRVVYKPREIVLDQEEFDRIVRMMEKVYVPGSLHAGETVDDPYLFSKRLLARICKGEKADGSIWKGAPGRETDDDFSVLRKRLAVYGFDVDTGKMISKQRESLAGVKNLISKEQGVDGRLKYGSGIEGVLNKEEQKTYKNFTKKIMKDFPELDAESDKLGIQILAMLKVKMDRISLEVGGDPRRMLAKDSTEIANLYQKTTESMGIAGKQRKDFMDSEGNRSVSDLVHTYHDRLKTFAVDLKDRYLQEAQLLLAAFKRGDIEEHDVVRFCDASIPEIEALLIANGMIDGKGSAE